MDREIKRKIQRLWRNQLLVGVFSIGLFGCSLGLFRSTLKHRPQQKLWVLALSQSVEDLTSEDSSLKSRELALDQIVSICQQNQLLKSKVFAKSLSQNGYQSELQAYLKHIDDGGAIKLERVQELVRERELVVSTELVLALELELELLWERDFVLLKEQVRVREQLLEIDLEQVRELVRELEHLRKQELELEYVREQVHELLRELLREEEFAQEQALVQDRLLNLLITKELEEYYNLKLIQESDLESHLNNEFDRQRTFLISLTFLSLSVILLLILLLTLTRLKSSHNLPPNSHLIAFIPEECVAEMGALERRMKKANASHWEIRLRLLEEFVTLIWVFYIQIKLENLSLPFQDKQIDE